MLYKRFCEYCGQPLSVGCDCAAIVAEQHERFIEEYESRPDVLEGWAFQDHLDMMRRER